MADIKYIAITIGPIFETMQNVTKPAGLWGASYLFSLISKELCDQIEKLYSGKIITPFFVFDDLSKEMQKTGIGFYHDHIVVKEADITKINDIIENEKQSIAKRVYSSLKAIEPSYQEDEIVSYISRYLQIYGIELYVPEEENVLLYVNRYLDSIELRKQYIPAETENYICSFLENEIIKNSFLTDDLEEWQLTGRYGQIKALPDIAESDSKEKSAGSDSKKDLFKRYSYFALVQSDGDRMGKIISEFKTEEEMKAFSTQCLNYAAKACRLIRNYGGVVIYAGGDDLQSIAPLTHGYDNLLGLIRSIVDVFDEVFIKGTKFEGAENRPTVSFGAEIVYEKYPLYEALKESFSLLYLAKKGGRDAIRIRLMKHSGQIAELAINRLSEINKENGGQKAFTDLEKMISNSLDGQMLHSVITHISEFSGYLDFAVKQYKETGNSSSVENFFINFFDNSGQEKWKDALGMVQGLVLHADSIKVDDDIVKKTGHSELITGVTSALRLVNFFNEKGVEDE